MKIATWNVALPVSEGRRKQLRVFTDRIGADVWVLTETHDSFTPGHQFSCSSAEGRDGRHRPGHRWVSIWSTCELEPLPTSDAKRTVAARLHPKGSKPFIVYGCVLPWLGSAWEGYPAKGGVAFSESLKIQSADWKLLLSKYPDHEFFVLGDFNQDLVRPRYYGSLTNRARLEEALKEVGLVALTAGDGDPIRRCSPPCACIDHICARRDSAWQANRPERWPDIPKPNKKLTDHFGVAVSFKTGH